MKNHQDELGSTSHIADASGALLEYYKYNLYGKPQYYDALNNQLSTSNYGVADLGNGGARWIPQLGLYDDRNRFMSPDLGRFLQPDPIGFKGDSSNLYRYCGNDWANRTDPLGLDALVVIGDWRDDGWNAAGHASMAITGRGIFSFGTDKGDWRVSATNFIAGQSQHRQQWLFVIPADAKHDQKMAKSLESNNKRQLPPIIPLIPAWNDNCSTRTRDALKSGGHDVGNAHTPAQLLGKLESEAKAGKIREIALPAKSQAPREAKQFDPKPQTDKRNSPGSPNQFNTNPPQASNQEPGMEMSAWGAVGAAVVGPADSRPAPAQ